MQTLIRVVFLSLIILFTTSIIYGQVKIQLKSKGNGFIKPVDISHAGDDRLFISEQRGQIHILRPDGSIDPTPFLNIQSQVKSSGNEQGLLGLVFHPDYATNGYFFVNYITQAGSTHVSRFQVDSLNPDLANITSEEVLLSIIQPFTNHNAGDLNFGPDGYLYIATGDGGSGGDPQNNGQKGLSLLGKILRIDVDNETPYAIPANNPFVNDTSVKDEIWSLGWRNPWRFSFDRQTGDMWVADVGQGDFEEVSFEAANSTGGLNFGWRCLEGANIFNATNCGQISAYEPPIFEYKHSFNVGSSITGGYVYRGSNYPILQGHYIFGDYNSGQVWTLYSNGNGGWDTTQQGALFGRDRLSTFGEDVNGELYVADHKSGTIYQIEESTNSIGQEPFGTISAFPNPFTHEVRLIFDNAQGDTYTLRIFDTQGKILREITDIKTEGYSLKRKELPSGIYLIELIGKRRLVGKVMIQ